MAAAVPATHALGDAIISAARAVDQYKMVQLRATTVQVLVRAQIGCQAPSGPVLVSLGNDLRIWVSFNLGTVSENDRSDLAEGVVKALVDAGLRLSSQMYPQAEDMAERLTLGEMLVTRFGT
ncbi:hypothetical protein [Streptacidiphilus cavernicola]|uniref:DUF3168 domain-containing protein n=1 Tax=Streptacidiphilus cavernicola TaxID=3342716 RepID=A0ABV6W224_9ACTN